MARTVLLADDSVTAQNMGRRILTDAGYEVITVNNGSAALKKIHENHPDLIVLDVYMPGYGGLEVCQRLKESGETMRIPVLLTVGKLEPFKTDEAKRVRADAHIVKPFEASELLAALAKLEDRIVPQADSARRKKKPSFWHDDPPIEPEWTDKAAYLAQMKQRRQADAVSPEEPATEPANAPEASAAPKRVEAPVQPPTEELPVIADVNIPIAPEEPVQPAAPVIEEPVAAVGANETQASAVVESAASEQQEGKSEPESITIPAAPEEPEPVKAAVAEAAPLQAAKTRWVAENVALSAEEAALELEQEMRAAEAAQNPPAENTPEEPVRGPEETSDESNGAAFAAAAGATTAAVAESEHSTGPEAPVPSDAAAAWQNWQQIRDAVMNVQSAAMSEGIAKAAEGAQAEAVVENAGSGLTPSPESSAASAESASIENGELASIVDSVLAELKPKLMKEIAKKLKK